MNSIVFLDFDGVLNCNEHFTNMYKYRIKLYEEVNLIPLNFVKVKIEDIDNNKLLLVKLLCEETNSKIVVTSSWRSIKIYPYIEKLLIEFGLPIIGKTKYMSSIRGLEIKEYLNTHKVDNYVILDDEIFKSFDEEMLKHLIKTSFYENGLTIEHVKKAIKMLKKK